MTLLNSLIPALQRTPSPTSNGAGQDLGPTVKPAYEVKETTDAYGVTVYAPGVTKDGLDITSEEGHLRIVGRRAWKQPEGWTSLHRESTGATFELILTHDNTVDVEKVAAELCDGILRVSLPKHETVKPRKIAVK